MKQSIFISSVQKELAEERRALKRYILGDALLGRFFDVFLFEDMPAADRRADKVYLDQVDRCDVYLGLLGNEYRYEDDQGVSPTEREFDRATAAGKQRLIFINASVQVMLFADRLEVWNPGELPPSLTPASLRLPHASIPRNPLCDEAYDHNPGLKPFIDRTGVALRSHAEFKKADLEKRQALYLDLASVIQKTSLATSPGNRSGYGLGYVEREHEE